MATRKRIWIAVGVFAAVLVLAAIGWSRMGRVCLRLVNVQAAQDGQQVAVFRLANPTPISLFYMDPVLTPGEPIRVHPLAPNSEVTLTVPAAGNRPLGVWVGTATPDRAGGPSTYDQLRLCFRQFVFGSEQYVWSD
jgi:hypothetical protein